MKKHDISLSQEFVAAIDSFSLASIPQRFSTHHCFDQQAQRYKAFADSADSLTVGHDHLSHRGPKYKTKTAEFTINPAVRNDHTPARPPQYAPSSTSLLRPTRPPHFAVYRSHASRSLFLHNSLCPATCCLAGHDREGLKNHVELHGQVLAQWMEAPFIGRGFSRLLSARTRPCCARCHPIFNNQAIEFKERSSHPDTPDIDEVLSHRVPFLSHIRKPRWKPGPAAPWPSFEESPPTTTPRLGQIVVPPEAGAPSATLGPSELQRPPSLPHPPLKQPETTVRTVAGRSQGCPLAKTHDLLPNANEKPTC